MCVASVVVGPCPSYLAQSSTSGAAADPQRAGSSADKAHGTASFAVTSAPAASPNTDPVHSSAFPDSETAAELSAADVLGPATLRASTSRTFLQRASRQLEF